MFSFPCIVPTGTSAGSCTNQVSYNLCKGFAGLGALQWSRKEMSHLAFLLWLHQVCRTDEEAPKNNKILPRWAILVVLSAPPWCFLFKKKGQRNVAALDSIRSINA